VIVSAKRKSPSVGETGASLESFMSESDTDSNEELQDPLDDRRHSHMLSDVNYDAHGYLHYSGFNDGYVCANYHVLQLVLCVAAMRLWMMI